jgi:hypothetical protein
MTRHESCSRRESPRGGGSPRDINETPTIGRGAKHHVSV